MKIAVLIPTYQDSQSVFGQFNFPYNPTPYLKKHDWKIFAIESKNTDLQVKKIIEQNHDLIFNLCDGGCDEDLAGVEVIRLLEKNNIPYTGSDSKFYGISRREFKEVSKKIGVLSPKSCFLKDSHEINKVIELLKFPMIVKHYNSYGSIGLFKDSKVKNLDELKNKVKIIISNFGEALIEEFIEGREFTVLIAENPSDSSLYYSFRSIEYDFPENEEFKHFDLKWVDFNHLNSHPCSDVKLDLYLRKICGELFIALKGSGYARFDIRVNNQNEAYIVDVNPNCSIFYNKGSEGSADLILLQYKNGHQRFVNMILRSAFNRVKKSDKYDQAILKEETYCQI